MLATALLALMSAIFVATYVTKFEWTWLAYLRALIGACADWFAVVALFRHPLGLPIPHTAIVPRNKNRIGTELGKFVEQNFLTPENIVAKLTQLDMVGHAAGWLDSWAGGYVHDGT